MLRRLEKAVPRSQTCHVRGIVIDSQQGHARPGDKFSPHGYLLKATAILHMLLMEGVGNSGQGSDHLDLVVAWEVCCYYY